MLMADVLSSMAELMDMTGMRGHPVSSEKAGKQVMPDDGVAITFKVQTTTRVSGKHP
jgi:hypothetical protein